MSVALFALLAACKQQPTTVAPAPSPTPAETAPTAPAEKSRDAMILALSVRDPEPRCEDVEAMAPSPLDDWRAMVATTMPPWLPMRAATCLITQHPAEARADFVTWVTTPEDKGLALLVLDHLDALPPDVATEVAKAAVSGPFPEEARERIAKSAAPEIRAIGGVTP
jgi:hypothetical protein